MSQDVLNQLIELQQLLAKKESEAAERKAEFEEQNVALFDSIDNIKDELDSVKEEMSDWAIANFAETGNKKPYGGITVQERKQYSFDNTAAIAWAEENAPVIVKVEKKLDKRKYQQFIGDGVAPGKVIIVPNVAISPDLSEYH